MYFIAWIKSSWHAGKTLFHTFCWKTSLNALKSRCEFLAKIAYNFWQMSSDFLIMSSYFANIPSNSVKFPSFRQICPAKCRRCEFFSRTTVKFGKNGSLITRALLKLFMHIKSLISSKNFYQVLIRSVVLPYLSLIHMHMRGEVYFFCPS